MLFVHDNLPLTLALAHFQSSHMIEIPPPHRRIHHPDDTERNGERTASDGLALLGTSHIVFWFLHLGSFHRSPLRNGQSPYPVGQLVFYTAVASP